jgi:hypothetical protein
MDPLRVVRVVAGIECVVKTRSSLRFGVLSDVRSSPTVTTVLLEYNPIRFRTWQSGILLANSEPSHIPPKARLLSFKFWRNSSDLCHDASRHSRGETPEEPSRNDTQVANGFGNGNGKVLPTNWHVFEPQSVKVGGEVGSRRQLSGIA